MRVAGVDGTKGGWVAVVLDDGGFVDDFLLRPVDMTFADLTDVDIIAIGIPIGFGPREADRAARAFLSGSASWSSARRRRHVWKSLSAPGKAFRLNPMRLERGFST